jgi:hypothetical protein
MSHSDTTGMSRNKTSQRGLATGRRAIRWYAFAAALLIESDSRGTRIFDEFWFGELVRELVKRSL